MHPTDDLTSSHLTRPKPRRGPLWRSRFLLAAFVVVCVLIPTVGTDIVARLNPGWIHPIGYGWWHTSGDKIEDTFGRPVRIAGVAWFGMDSLNWVPAGLDFQPYRKIMHEVKHLGYNTIRIPISNELVERNPIVASHVKANPQFKGKHALAVLDDICDYAEQLGLKIILDDQRSAANSIANGSRLREPLWYTKQYPQSAWIHDWVSLARRYKTNNAVIGFDLRNEPHTGPPGPWSVKAYLHQGATWGPYKGRDNLATDWRLAAERAGNAVLHVNPHLLLFIEGLQLYPDPQGKHGVDAYWWGSVLQPVRKYPIQLNVANQMVYSPHEYGPQKTRFSWFHDMTYASLTRVWNRMWGFILTDKRLQAPVLLGEVGTCSDAPSCVSAVRPSNQAHWVHLLIRYLRSHPYVGYCVWSLNGTTSNDTPNGNGLLNDTWTGLRNARLQKLFATVQGHKTKVTQPM